MSPALSVTLSVGEYAESAQLVADSPHGSIYATAQYREIPCPGAGGEFRILGVRRGDQLIGGVRLSERKSFDRNYVGPRLLLYYLGPVFRRHESKYPSHGSAQNVATLTALADKMAALGYAKTKGAIGWRTHTVLSHSYAPSRQDAAGTVRRLRTHYSR